MFAKLKEYLVWIGGALVALLFLLFKFEQSKRRDAESKLESAATAKDDAVLGEKQAEKDREIQAVDDNVAKEVARPMTEEETLEFLKKLGK